MSFMAGFGPAFAEAFNSGMAQNRKNDADSFNKAWELFLKKDEERTKAEAANKKDWEWAEETAKLNRLPPEAAYKLYQYKQNGNFSESQLNAIAADTQGWKVGRDGEDVEVEYTDPRDEFGINEEQPQEEPQEGAQEGATANKRNTDFRGNIEERFKNVREPQQPQAPQAPQSPAIQGGPFARTGPRGDEAARADQLTRRVAQQAGVPVDQVQRTMSGSSAWQPPANSSDRIASYIRSPGPVEPDKIDNLREAFIERSAAQRSGDPERIAIAEDRINQIQSAISYEEFSKARAQGLAAGGDTFVNIFDKDGNYLRQARAREEMDGKFIEVGGPNHDQEISDGRVIKVGPKELEEMDKIQENLRKPLDENRKKASAVRSSMRGAEMLSTIMKDSGNRLVGPWTSQIASTVERWISDAGIAAETVSGLLARKGSKIEDLEVNGMKGEQVGQYLQNERDKIIANGVNSLGAQKALWDTEIAMLAYNIAMAKGQEGRALSEDERIMFQNAIDGKINPEVFMAQLSNIIIPMMREVDAEGYDVLNRNNMDINRFEDRWGYRPKWVEYSSIEEEIKKNPELSGIYNNLLKSGSTTRQPVRVEKAGDMPDGLPPEVSDVWDYMTPEQRKLWQN